MSESSPHPLRDEDDAEPSAPAGRERRLTYRAYSYWEEVAGSRKMPAWEDFSGEGFAEFRDRAFLIEFDEDDYLEARFGFVGADIEAESGKVAPGSSIRAVPQDSLLSRLADYYLQAIAHEAPVGFEAEYERRDGAAVLYRGILLPMAPEDGKVDRLVGMLSWKVVPADAATAPEPEIEPKIEPAAEPAAEAEVAARIESETENENETEAEEVGLQGALAACRSAAEELAGHETRLAERLRSVLSKIYAFFLLGELQPGPFAAILRHEGLTMQERAPFTPVLKLVFGKSFDKSRLTEYAAVLSHVRRVGLKAEEVRGFLAGFEGGLKAIVAAERAARREERGAAPADRRDGEARRRLQERPGLALAENAVVAPGEGDFVLLLARRRDGKLVEPVAVVEESPRALARILRRAAESDDDPSEGTA